MPVLLPYFHLKNDVLTQNLPTRFVFSESLRSGFSPFWNPYIHFGNPQYGDMNNGFWNPIQWLIGSTVGYNIYTITFEEMFYILIGGLGMYKVCKEFFKKDTAILTGLTYMCCGFIAGRLQYFCWITGAGFFPFVLLYFIRINKNAIVSNFLLGAISVFLFVASTHPGLIIGAAYFFLFAILLIYFFRKSYLQNLYQKHFWLVNSCFLLLSCILSIIVIVSNSEVLQYISRGTKVSLPESLMTPTTLPSYLSLAFPLPVHKSGAFHTDIAMRNMYIGIAHLLGIGYILKTTSLKKVIGFGWPLVFFILLSAGSYFKIFAWHYLPYLGFVRLNGEFSFFVIVILLIYGSAGIQKMLEEKPRWTKKALNFLLYLCIEICLLSIILIFGARNSILFSSSISFSNFKTGLKDLIDDTSCWELFLLQSMILVIVTILLKKYLFSKTKVLFILLANLVITTWFVLPYTGLGMMSKKAVQQVIDKFPKGIQTQDLVAINDADYIQPKNNSQFQLIASYSKKIGSKEPDQYPVQLRTNQQMINDTALYHFIKKQSYLFLSEDTALMTSTNFDNQHLQVQTAGAGFIKCTIHNDQYKWLTLLQNNYKYWKVKIDNKPVAHFTGFKTFISVPVPAGEHVVEFSFDSTRIKKWAYLNLILLIMAIAIAMIPNTGKFKLFK
ncbi:MAG: hypothetical protein KDC06_01040 [Chitinophagaceae bacterium]|nr:hypothetical protein [Chitinophagaceae bacterium]